MMGHEVVVVGGSLAAPVAAIAVSTLGMGRVAKTLADDAPLHGHVLVAIDRAALVHRPADGTVVDDDVSSVVAAQPVRLALRGLSGTKAHVADDDVWGGNHKIPVGHADAVARCRLSRDGDIAVAQFQLRFQVYGTADIEDNGTRTALPTGPPQGAAARVVEVGHVIHLPAPASRHVAAVALGTWKGGSLLSHVEC